MSVPLPWSISLAFDLQVTRLEANAQGHTIVECTLGGTPIRQFILDQNVVVVGADALEGPIRNMVCNIIGRSLEVSE